MESPDDIMQQIGAFEPSDAKRVIASLETNKIPFEVEADDSALFAPNRWLQLQFGMYPDGSKVVIFVPESRVPNATEILNTLFPG